MLSLTLAEIVVLIKTYGYWLIFPIAFVEGPIITIICGWLSSLGILNFFLVYLLVITADLSGDILYYSIGYWGGPPLIRKFGKFLRIDLDQVLKMKNHFDNHGGKILAVGKITPHIGVITVLVGAGLSKYRFSLFIYYCLLTEMVAALILVSLGFYLGSAYQQIAIYLNYWGAAVSIFAVLVVLVIIYRFYWGKNKK